MSNKNLCYCAENLDHAYSNINELLNDLNEESAKINTILVYVHKKVDVNASDCNAFDVDTLLAESDELLSDVYHCTHDPFQSISKDKIDNLKKDINKRLNGLIKTGCFSAGEFVGYIKLTRHDLEDWQSGKSLNSKKFKIHKDNPSN